MQADLELAVSHFLPACPDNVKVPKKQENAQISGLGGNFKAGTVPKTGVEVLYHKPPEFSQLGDAQRDELLEIRPPKKGRGKKESHQNKCDRGGKRNSHGSKKPWEKKSKGQVSDAMKIQKEEDKEDQKKETDDLFKLASLISAVQPVAVYSNEINSNAATVEVKIN